MKCSKQLVFIGLGMHKYALPTPSKMAAKIQKILIQRVKSVKNFLRHPKV